MKFIPNKERYTEREINLFGNAESIIKKLEEDRVFSIEIYEKDNKILVREGCDDWYVERLNISELRDLATVFNGLADYLETKKESK